MINHVEELIKFKRKSGYTWKRIATDLGIADITIYAWKKTHESGKQSTGNWPRKITQQAIENFIKRESTSKKQEQWPEQKQEEQDV